MPLKHRNPYLDTAIPLGDTGVHLGKIEDYVDDLADHLNLLNALKVAADTLDKLIQERWPIPTASDKQDISITFDYADPHSARWALYIVNGFFINQQISVPTEIEKVSFAEEVYRLYVELHPQACKPDDVIRHMEENGPVMLNRPLIHYI